MDFQVDTWQGPWRAATRTGGRTFRATTAPLQPGMHILYAHATDAQAATSASIGSPLTGAIAAYLFLVAPGAWGTAVEVPGLGALNKGGKAAVASVSCAAAGTCAAGGSYTDRSGHLQAFVAGERNGAWGTAVEVPGLGALNKGGKAAQIVGPPP